MASIILPNQLFPEPVQQETKYLVEHEKFFQRVDFHRQKLVLHRASMKAYQEKHGADYIEFDENIEQIFRSEDKIAMYDPVDHELREEFKDLAEESGTEIEFKENPGFLACRKFNKNYFEDNRYFQLHYYQKMRKKLDVLVDQDGNPVGGKWSFDPENREKMPEDMETPEIPVFESSYVRKAKEYVQENFGDNPGNVESFRWPTTREEALENLEDFLENRLENFGKYQDAFDRDLRYGFHSLLSSSLNTGLITPGEVVEKTLEKHEYKEYPLNSLEGFLRQIIGWREFVRAMYQLEPGMEDSNFWNNENDLPEEFYTGETGIEPVDVSIVNAKEDAYCHHIERLMVLGNMMLLLEIDPDEIYDWFMEMFIDSYEWVTVPNVYGMSQYAWPEMMTKPYISSSNYVKKMSHYSGEWEETWDGLYWSFIHKHRGKIEDIQRLSFMVSQLDKMDEKTVECHRENAREFKSKLGIE